MWFIYYIYYTMYLYYICHTCYLYNIYNNAEEREGKPNTIYTKNIEKHSIKHVLTFSLINKWLFTMRTSQGIFHSVAWRNDSIVLNDTYLCWENNKPYNQ